MKDIRHRRGAVLVLIRKNELPGVERHALGVRKDRVHVRNDVIRRGFERVVLQGVENDVQVLLDEWNDRDAPSLFVADKNEGHGNDRRDRQAGHRFAVFTYETGADR